MSDTADVEDLDQLSDDEFRTVVRNFIETNFPPELRYPPRRLHCQDSTVWFRILSRQGWLCPNWPKEFGGMGISAGRQLIFPEEKERHGCTRQNDMGMTMLGPLLIRHGTNAQQDYFLPRILSGERI